MLGLQHKVWEIALNNKFYIAPFDLKPGDEVLDVGCGTGGKCTSRGSLDIHYPDVPEDSFPYLAPTLS